MYLLCSKSWSFSSPVPIDIYYNLWVSLPLVVRITSVPDSGAIIQQNGDVSSSSFILWGHACHDWLGIDVDHTTLNSGLTQCWCQSWYMNELDLHKLG